MNVDRQHINSGTDPVSTEKSCSIITKHGKYHYQNTASGIRMNLLSTSCENTLIETDQIKKMLSWRSDCFNAPQREARAQGRGQHYPVWQGLMESILSPAAISIIFSSSPPYWKWNISQRSWMSWALKGAQIGIHVRYTCFRQHALCRVP